MLQGKALFPKTYLFNNCTHFRSGLVQFGSVETDACPNSCNLLVWAAALHHACLAGPLGKPSSRPLSIQCSRHVSTSKSWQEDLTPFNGTDLLLFWRSCNILKQTARLQMLFCWNEFGTCLLGKRPPRAHWKMSLMSSRTASVSSRTTTFTEMASASRGKQPIDGSGWLCGWRLGDIG